jgi:glycosyltransferase involved in cell wall biosynthesis
VPPLATALRSLILDPDLRERLGRSGLDRIHSRFLWSRSAEQLRRVYHDTIRSNARPA